MYTNNGLGPKSLGSTGSSRRVTQFLPINILRLSAILENVLDYWLKFLRSCEDHMTTWKFDKTKRRKLPKFFLGMQEFFWGK